MGGGIGFTVPIAPPIQPEEGRCGMSENAEPDLRPHDRGEPSKPVGNEAGSEQSCLLSVDPPLTRSEAIALQTLSLHRIWEHGAEHCSFGVWALERLDRRGWLHARQVTVASEKNQILKYTPIGPWFYPTRNRVTDGREDWPSIWTHFKYADPTAGQRIYSQVALTDDGMKAAKLVDIDRIADPGPLESVAQSLEEISAEWRRGDEEMSWWIRSGMGTDSGGFEKILGIHGGERAIVLAIVKDLRVRLVPAIALLIDVPLRDDLRALVSDLDPEQFCVDEFDGEETPRWRLRWARLNCQSRVDELVALLRGLESGQKDTKDDGEWWPLGQLPKTMGPRIRAAAQPKRKTMRVRTRDADGTKLYSVDDVRRWWPSDFNGSKK